MRDTRHIYVLEIQQWMDSKKLDYKAFMGVLEHEVADRREADAGEGRQDLVVRVPDGRWVGIRLLDLLVLESVRTL